MAQVLRVFSRFSRISEFLFPASILGGLRPPAVSTAREQDSVVTCMTKYADKDAYTNNSNNNR